ncbi:MAG: spore cortex biosynthesis protein YabQ [Oscillospiraceae bacterium]|nr:spore cortex biosynthesis protein YabQ [Oscillospiraceae bacterium]
MIIPDTYDTVTQELCRFGGAVLLGLPLGLLTDTLRFLRRLWHHPRPLEAAEDALVPVCAALLLIVYTDTFGNGVLRGYYAAGALIGWVLYLCSLSRPVMAVLSRTARVLRVPAGLVRRGFALICKNTPFTFVESSKNDKGGQKNTQNRLHRHPRRVYNDYM